MLPVENNDTYLHIHGRMWTQSFERKGLAQKKLEVNRNNYKWMPVLEMKIRGNEKEKHIYL